MENSPSGSGKVLYAVPDDLRGKLAAPVGILLSAIEDILREISGSRLIVTVGDIVTLDLLESGITPDISIVDYITKRDLQSNLKERFAKFPQTELFIKNPPGVITEALWDAIKKAFDEPEHIRIVVDGEEDLASLACISLSLENTTVIYGIPNRGASIHHVDRKLKKMVNDALDKMRIE